MALNNKEHQPAIQKNQSFADAINRTTSMLPAAASSVSVFAQSVGDALDRIGRIDKDLTPEEFKKRFLELTIEDYGTE